MSELLKQLFSNGTIALGVFETLYMTVISALIAYLIGLPIGVILFITDKGGIKQNEVLNKILGVIVNIFRSMPFLILMVAMLPVAKFLIGTSLGNGAMIIMLVIAAAPYIARMVESSLKEVDAGVIEAARSMGTSTFGIIRKVLLPEAKPSLLVGAVISTVTIIGYSAMAGTIGGTGLGMIAITYGYQRFNEDIIWVCVVLIVVIVQSIQEIGMRLAKRLDKRISKSG
ncbi:MAG: methionine ABC transporter permease [Candidatus Scatosoma sp.]